MPAPIPELFGGAYRGSRVLVTGHTGFKGSWLALWLTAMGAEVTGIALPPEHERDHFVTARIESLVDHRICDIRDAEALEAVVAEARPQVVFHLAAQALVRRGYERPLETFDTNLSGTVNLLDACRDLAGLQSVVVVTSDKCYENLERDEPYRETDRLGGRDPYSASKAAAEIATAAMRDSFFSSPDSARIATARAGNVIGGGDWSDDRIVCDFFRAREAGAPLGVRNPESVRPWQHVLEPLAGYLRLAQLLAAEDGAKHATAYNFGPDADAQVTVSTIADMLVSTADGSWEATPEPGAVHEATLLALDASKARTELGWQPVLSVDEAVMMTAEHYMGVQAPGDATALSTAQIARFTRTAAERGATYLMEA